MTDRITAALMAAQKKQTVSLWTPSQSVTFTPVVLTRAFGDGRALYRITTINNRPRWWLIRGCSSWTPSNDPHDGMTPVYDVFDQIVDAIAGEFDGLEEVDHDCDEGDVDDQMDGDENGELQYRRRLTGGIIDPACLPYPAIDDRLGTAWQVEAWPQLPGIDTIPHPSLTLDGMPVTILAERHAVTSAD